MADAFAARLKPILDEALQDMGPATVRSSRPLPKAHFENLQKTHS
jgi:hypothetical protein